MVPGSCGKTNGPLSCSSVLSTIGWLAQIQEQSLPFQGVKEVRDAIPQAHICHMESSTHNSQHGVRTFCLKRTEDRSKAWLYDTKAIQIKSKSNLLWRNILISILIFEPRMVAYTCNPRTWEVEARRIRNKKIILDYTVKMKPAKTTRELPFFKFIFISCMLFACIYVSAPWMCLVPPEVRGEHQVPWNWNYRWLAMSHQMDTKIWTRFSGKAAKSYFRPPWNLKEH